jgi:hypothetical protein
MLMGTRDGTSRNTVYPAKALVRRLTGQERMTVQYLASATGLDNKSDNNYGGDKWDDDVMMIASRES